MRFSIETRHGWPYFLANSTEARNMAQGPQTISRYFLLAVTRQVFFQRPRHEAAIAR